MVEAARGGPQALDFSTADSVSRFTAGNPEKQNARIAYCMLDLQLDANTKFSATIERRDSFKLVKTSFLDLQSFLPFPLCVRVRVFVCARTLV